MKRATIAILALAAGCSAPASTSNLAHEEYSGKAMGSSLHIEVYGTSREICERAIREARAEIDRLDAMMTDWKEQSPLMDINYAAGRHAVRTPPELLFLIKRSLDISRMSDGAFDISFAGAGKLWNWRAPDPRIPDAETVRRSLENVDYRSIVVDERAGTVFLSKPGMRIGLGAIAPGYAADQAMGKIRALGIRDAVVDMSGDILAMGTKEGRPWQIGIRHPRKDGANLAVIGLSNGAVSTSGDYERYFIKDGKRYCHIIDPRTGYPADRCRSVTVTAPVLAVADGLATAVFVLGPEKGMELIERLEGVGAVIVSADGQVHVSQALRGLEIHR